MELEPEDALSEFDRWGRTELEIGSRIRPALFNDPSSKFLLRAADKALKTLYRTCAQESAEPCSHTWDQHTLMFLGCRALTDTLGAVRLLLAGYYLQALILERDVLESGFLLQFFKEYPDKIGLWRTADVRERMRVFSIGKISKKLDARGVRHRYDEYKEYCELAAHPTAQGRVLTHSKVLERPMVGPFFNEDTAKKVLLRITTNVCDVCLNLLHTMELLDTFAEDWNQIMHFFDESNASGQPNN